MRGQQSDHSSAEDTNARARNGSGAQVMSNEDLLCSPTDDLLVRLQTSQNGLSDADAGRLLEIWGPNEIERVKKRTALFSFLHHFRNPLVLILLVAGLVSLVPPIEEYLNAAIIFVIVLMSVALDIFQENRATRAAEELRQRVATTATALRDGTKKEVRIADLVPGDVVMLSAGDIVPADARVLAAKDFFIDQSALTGESFPAEKMPVPVGPSCVSILTEWKNYLFMGTSVMSGSASAVIVKTGAHTEYGGIIGKLIARRPETEFERGLRRFGAMITEVTFLLVMFVFLVNIAKPFFNPSSEQTILESFLFAVALAVGLTPELLPMILSINLSRGAIAMSKKGVIVKRLASIQNFGSMDVLCTDKTGTLTENRVTLMQHTDLAGNDDEKVLLFSFLNSHFQTGLRSPLDEAILAYKELDVSKYVKIDEVPFDFLRRRLSVVVELDRQRFFISKGAPEAIIEVCRYYEIGGRIHDVTGDARSQMKEQYLDLSSKGFRVLGISYKRVREEKPIYAGKDERDMVFLGFVAFLDPPKESAKESLALLKRYGIDLKIVTGDNELVTRNVCTQLGFEARRIVLGSEFQTMTDDVFARVVEEANIFARVTPAQKDRILNALRRNNHVVGFLGDGINDAPSMKMSDVSISVNNAVDVAKESADIILLDKDLTVLESGVLEGRKTFGNTMKYILMGISSNFGNMFSAAGASVFLPFLPMKSIQILLNNLLYDISETTIPSDNVDSEYVEKPKTLDIRYIRNFMLYFGPLSSVFDFLTFFVMLNVFNAWNNEPLFQTAWFVESLCTQTLIIFCIRTRRSPFFKSKPNKLLVISSLSVVAAGIIIPSTVVGDWFEFMDPPPLFYLFLLGFVVAYFILVETLKRYFYKRYAAVLEKTKLAKI